MPARHTTGPHEARAPAGLARRLLSPVRRAAARLGARGRWLRERRPRVGRVVALAFTVGLAGLGLHGLSFEERLSRRLPSRLDWAALAALVERDARPGDALALSPEWAERARLVVPAGVPVLAYPRFAGEDLTGVRRIWLVSLPRAPGFRWTAEEDLLLRAARSDPPLAVGAFEITRYEIALPHLPLAFLPDRLAGATVRLGDAPCPPAPAGGFRCPGDALVVRTVREVGGRPRPCLLLPVDAGGGAPLTLTFPRVRIGRTFRGHAGAAGDPDGGVGAPLGVVVRLDGEPVGAAEIAGQGWLPFELDTARHAGRTRDVSVAIAAAGPAAPVCLDAVILP